MREGNLRPAKQLAAVVLVIAVAIVGVGSYKYFTAPERPSSEAFLAGSATMDDVRESADAEASALKWLAVGSLVTVVGLSLLAATSRGLRRARSAILEEQIEAAARGAKRGLSSTEAPEVRMASLQALREQGHITPAEYEAKRQQILTAI